MNFNEFLHWEQTTRDTIDFKKIYVDVAGDLNAGLILSEIIYWYLPSVETNKTKLRVQKKGHFWIAVRRYEWWDRTRMSPKQADRAIRLLINAGLVEKRTFKFKGEPTVHIRLLQANFLEKLNFIIQNPPRNPNLPDEEEPNSLAEENEFSLLENTVCPETETPYTESTPETSQHHNKLLPLSDERGGTPAGGLEEENEEAEGIQFDEIDQAIAEAWKTTAPAYIYGLRQTLLGLHTSDSEHFAANVKPPAKPDEIRELGDYYPRHAAGMKLPSVPAKVQEWFYQVRQLQPSYVTHGGHIVPLQVKVPPEIDTPRKALNYIREFYPEECHRVESLFYYMDNHVQSDDKREMVIEPHLLYGGEEVRILVPIPRDLLGEDFSWNAIKEYLRENYPDEADSVEAQLWDIYYRRDREMSAILGHPVGGE